MGWLTADGKWKARAWNPTAGALEEVPNGRTWTTDAIVAETVELRKLVTSETIYRFQSIKGLTKEPQTAWVQLALEVSMRPQGLGHCCPGSAAQHYMPLAVACGGSGEDFHNRSARFVGRILFLVYSCCCEPGPLVSTVAFDLSDWRTVEAMWRVPGTAMFSVDICGLCTWTISTGHMCRVSLNTFGTAFAKIRHMCYSSKVTYSGCRLHNSGAMYRCPRS
eukprot:s3954_g3.t1